MVVQREYELSATIPTSGLSVLANVEERQQKSDSMFETLTGWVYFESRSFIGHIFRLNRIYSPYNTGMSANVGEIS